jgi:hypothetical protein
MATVSSSPAGRRRWHPVTVAGALTASSFAAAFAVAAVAGPAWPVLGAWLLMGTASGFATSGST